MKTIECLDALRRARRSAVLFAVATLVACGGGGGGGGGVAEPPSSGPVVPKAFQGAAAIDAIDPSGLRAESAQVAVDAGGNAMAVWEQSDGTRDNAWASRYDFATGQWDAPQLIETNNAGEVYALQIAAAPNGDAVAVWVQRDGTRRNAWANRYDAAAGKWGVAQLLETDDTGDAGYPQIAMDDAGNAISVWMQSDGTRYNIWANRYDAVADKWGMPKQLETDSDGDAEYPQIAMNARGDAVAVWEQSDGTRDNGWANGFDASTGQWGAAKLLEADNSGDGGVWEPQIAIAPNGNAVAIWEQDDGTRWNVWANRYDAAKGQWGGPQLVESGDASDADYPQIAIDANGNAMAVWQQYAGPVEEVWANRYDAATGVWGVPQLLRGIDSDVGYPQIAMDANGNAVAVWSQDDGTRDKVWAAQYDAGTAKWSAPEQIAAETNDAEYAQVAMNAKGNAVVVWEMDAPAGARDRIFANVFR